MQLDLNRGRAAKPRGKSAYQEALDVIGGLSSTSKMPWYSWSISAEICITGSKLRKVKGSTCENCYALKGLYRMENVKEAHTRRLKAFSDPLFEDSFVTVLNQLFKNTRSTYMSDGLEIKENRFRWMDSGDIQSEHMLDVINRIASRTPQILHWLPTREIWIVKAYLDGGGVLAKNLVVRISAPMVGQSFSNLPHGLPFSTVGVDADGIHQCPAAASQGNKCLDCTACWSQAVVNYPLH